MKKVVITGAAGFIGYALADKLIKDGVEVYAVVKKNKEQLKRWELCNNCHIVVCSLEDIALLPDLISERGFDVFYHLAWQGVSDEECMDLNVQLNNVKWTAEAVRAAGELECRKFVFASSIMEYELDKLMQSVLPSGERNIYRAAKRMASATARIFCNKYQVIYSSALVTNVYGPGEFSGRFVISTLRKMLKGEKLNFSEATQMYDFCYIDDAVVLMILIGEKGENNCSYYIGSACPRPLREYIQEMKNCAGGTSEMSFGAGGEFIGVSLEYNEFDIYSSEKKLGYKTKTEFGEGIEKTLKWIKAEGGAR